MSKAEQLRRFYEAHIACGDLSEAAQSELLAEIAAAETRECRRRHEPTDD